MNRSDMSRQDQLDRIEDLRWMLSNIESQQEDKTLSHSDQKLLDQAWEDVTNELDELEGVVEAGEEIEAEWRDATEYLEEEDDDAEEFVRSTTVPAGLDRRGKLVTFAPAPPRVQTTNLTIVQDYVAPPPPPKGGECADDNYGDLYEEDEREGCEHCAGCTYCFEGAGYDGADEV